VLGSSFNANGFDGIFVETSTFKSGTVTFDDGMPESLQTGLLIKNSRVIANGDDVIEFDGVTAQDVTFTGDIIAENGTVTADGLGVGVFIRDTDLNDGFESHFTNLVIEDSYLGQAPDGAGGSFGGNAKSGFDANDSNFTGVAFVDSFFNGNGTSGDGDGIRFLGGSIDQGQVTFYQGGMTVPAVTTGFTLKDSQANGMPRADSRSIPSLELISSSAATPSPKISVMAWASSAVS
jgi:hypothetical protein